MKFKTKAFLNSLAMVLGASVWCGAGAVSAVAAQAGAHAANGLANSRAPKPAEFASVFSFGYGGDSMPKDDAKFAELLKKLHAAGFNVIHCTYTPSRLALCKAHGVKMMVDLLAPEHHVYKSPDKAKAVCEKLRGNPDVWGYNIWNDIVGKSYAGRIRDINAVRSWDPTHPAYCGGYRNYGMNHITNADILGYYDFHWSRGIDSHQAYLQQFLGFARRSNAIYYTWLAAVSGQPGDENFHRSLWSANLGIACGLKGVLWFLGNSLMDQKTLEWKPAGADIARVNSEIMPLKSEIMKIGLPTAVYGTKITKTLQNQPLPGGAKEIQAPGLAAVPADFWIQPVGGEFVMGVFKDPDGHTALYVANYNAYAPQHVALKLGKPVKASLFSRKQARWEPLEIKANTISFPLDPGGGELIRFE